MKLVRNSRPITAIILGLIIVVFLIGMLRAFTSVGATTFQSDRTLFDTASLVGMISSLTPGPSETPFPLSTPTHIVTTTPTPVLVSADTTGIIALAVVIVMITLVGVGWGAGNYPRKNVPKK
jgi:hypothetical protein